MITKNLTSLLQYADKKQAGKEQEVVI